MWSLLKANLLEREASKMAVPKKKVSKSRGRSRRSHYKIKAPAIVKDKTTGLYRLAHHLCDVTGTYNGKKIVEVE